MGCSARPFCTLFFRAGRTVRRALPPFSTFDRALFNSSASGDGLQRFFDAGGEEDSLVYKRHLQCHRPPSLPPWTLRPNTCSLIGKVVVPLRSSITKRGRVGAYTLLKVETPPRSGLRHTFSPSGFRIMIWMWDDLAQASLKHLKPNDFIYVSGRLSSYGKADASGNTEIMQSVDVTELNYVDLQAGTGYRTPIPAETQIPGGKDWEEKTRERLHLWQIFFANPQEWWDNRRCKPNRRCPDFKHKHTGEALWIDPRDPPWISRQLQLVDLRRAGQTSDSRSRHVSDLL